MLLMSMRFFELGTEERVLEIWIEDRTVILSE